MKKRLLSCLMFLVLLTVSLGGNLTTAIAGKPAEKITYVAFGDSIAAGYGLEGYTQNQKNVPPDSYQALLANFLKIESHNYAVTGDTSAQCIEILNSGKADKDLKNADLVSLSIGSNDLLQPFIQIAMEYYKIDPGTVDESAFADGFAMPDIDLATMLKYYSQLDGLIEILSNNDTLHAQAKGFADKLQEILSILHTKAPAAEIYVTNIYNPFQTVPKMGDLADSYVQEINQAFSAKAKDYTLIDVYAPFHEENLTNVNFDITNLSNASIDPHPSVAGHKVIGDLFIAALKKAHKPKPVTVKSITPGTGQKLTVKTKLPSDADGIQIRYSTKKNGTFKELAKTTKATYRTKSKKLKSGKTYYIKVRAYKTIKGVTYYGKNSSAQKIKIKALK